MNYSLLIINYSLEVSIFFCHILIFKIRLNILISTTANSKHNDIIRFECHFLQCCYGVSTLYCRYDTLHTSKFITGIDRFVIIYCQNVFTSFVSQVSMHRTYTRIIQTGGDCESLLYLAVLILHDKSLCPMNYARGTTMNRGSCIIRINAMATSLSKIYLHTFIINIMVYRAGSIRATTNTSYQIIRIITSYLLLKLPFYFL